MAAGGRVSPAVFLRSDAVTQHEWDPLAELTKVQERMNRLFESALAKTDFDAEGGIDSWVPVADVYEIPGSLVLSLELPGIPQSAIDLRVDGNDLVVEGERRMQRAAERGEQFHRVERSYGKFIRRFALPPDVDRASVQANLRDGVLRISLARHETGREPIHVAIR